MISELSAQTRRSRGKNCRLVFFWSCPLRFAWKDIKSVCTVGAVKTVRLYCTANSKVREFTRAKQLRQSIFGPRRCNNAGSYFRTFSQIVLILSLTTREHIRLPSISQDDSRARPFVARFCGWIWNKVSLEPATFVWNWKMGFLLRPSFRLSRSATTGFFSDVLFVFLTYRVHAPRKLGENLPHRRQRDLHAEGVRRGSLKLHRWNWTLPTLSRYRRNYRKLNTHTDSHACIYAYAHVG